MHLIRSLIATLLVSGLMLLAATAADSSPFPIRTSRYGGIGATITDFDAAHPHGTGTPPAGTTYYRVDQTLNGRVTNYHVVIGWRSRYTAAAVLKRLTGQALPSDAHLVKPYNGYCAIYRSRWLGKILWRLPRPLHGARVFRNAYIIVYAPTRAGAKRANVGFPWNGSSASLAAKCRG